MLGSFVDNVVSRQTDTGGKGYPFLGSAQGVKEAGRRPTRVNHVELSDPSFKQTTQRRREFTQVQAVRRLKALLLHVWIEMFIMV